MNKVYTRINWENEPSDNTPINETNLNKMDAALDEVDNRLIAQDVEKATKIEVSTLVADVDFDENTGIITVTRKNGSSFTIDTKLEKIAINFTYDKDTQQIILTLIDGTKQYIDLSALITQYEFLDSDTITFVVQADGSIKAEVLDGSITENKLQSNYLAQIKVETAKSETYMNNASSSATQAKSYAVGGTGTRTGEDTDNAKYYYQQAKSTDVGQLRQDVDEINRNLNSEISRAKEADETLKSRVDTITSLPEGSTTGDAELQDIRVKADGTIAENAGNAVREQFNELKSDLVNLNITYNSQYINPNGWEIGKAYYKGSSTRVDSTANELLKCIKIESLKIGTYHYQNINPGFTCIQKKSNNEVKTLKELTSSDLLNGKFTVDESFDMYITTNSSFESNESMLCDGDFPSDFVFGIYGRLYDGCDLSKLDEEIIKSKFPNLYGKKWCCVGDSITDHAIPNVTYYDTLIANDTGIIPTNLGVAGTGYRREEGNGNCFYQRIESSLPTDCEYVTIMGSINDSIHNLGTPTDESTTDTVCGRINLAINKVFEKIPNAKLGLISPLPASTQNPNNDNCFIANLVVAQKEICRLRGIPYLDLFHSSNLRPWDSAQNDIFNEHNESSNVHPLTNGYLIFYRRILDFINSL